MTFAERLKASSETKWPWFILALVLVHLAVTRMVMPFRVEHFALDALILATGWWGGKARQFSIMVLPIWLVGSTYELSGSLMFLQGDRVHIQGIYELEKMLFGINTDQGRLILSEYFAIHNWPVLDLFAGFFYSFYFWHIVLVPMLWIFLYPRQQPRAAWAFLAANILGLIVFLLFPVAPPWYVADYGFELVQGVKPSAAGAVRFDQLLGITYFEEFYKHNATVFGAMPSLHFGYPMAVAFASLSMPWKWRIYCFSIPIGVGFSTFYLQHHYLLDVIGGAAVAIVAYMIAIYGVHRKQWDGTVKGFWRLMLEVPEGYEAPS